MNIDHPIYPNMATRVAERAAELRARGLESLAASIEHVERPIIDWPDTTEPVRKRRLWPAVLALLLLLGFAGWFPPSDAHAATPTRCGVVEDDPAWSWSECGNLARGVIMRDAPKRCTWKGDREGCIRVVDAAQYCHLRRAHRIDLKRTRSLKGDGYARDHGCDPALYAQDAR